MLHFPDDAAAYEAFDAARNHPREIAAPTDACCYDCDEIVTHEYAIQHEWLIDGESAQCVACQIMAARGVHP